MDLQPLNEPVEEDVFAAPLDEIREWEALLRQARSKRKYWAEREEEAKAMVADYLGDAEFGSVGGHITVRYRRMDVNRFDTKRFRREHPELAEKYTNTNEERRMEIVDEDD